MFVHNWLMTAIVASALVGSTPSGPIRVIGDPSRDARLTMQARKLLAEDPELADWNVGVSVNNRVAVLWGPAPSAAVAFRAEQCLKAMAELAEVRNELIVFESLEPERRPSRPDVRPRYIPELMPPTPPAEPRLKPPSSGVLTGKAKTIPSQTTTASKKPAELAPKADVLSETDRTLTAAVRIYLDSKTAYSIVQFTVQDGRVYLKAAAQDSDTLHEAARGISRLPNVEGVILTEKLPAR